MTFPKVIRGRAWKFGANIDTDQIIPAKYAIYSLDEKELGKHAMEGVPDRESWAAGVAQGSIVAADMQMHADFFGVIRLDATRRPDKRIAAGNR